MSYPAAALTGPSGRLRSMTPAAVWLQSFLLFEIACQLALLTSTIAGYRVIVRSAYMRRACCC